MRYGGIYEYSLVSFFMVEINNMIVFLINTDGRATPRKSDIYKIPEYMRILVFFRQSDATAVCG